MTDNRDHEEKLGGEQTVSKTKNTIFRQFMRPLTVFRIILILFLFLAMFCFTTYRTWSEKKQFSQDISDYVAFSLGDYECITQLTEYMHDHFSEMELVYDEEQPDYKAQSGELSPAKILMSANEQLCEGNDAELFVTVWLAVIELSTGKGKAANAGHEHPTLRRKDGKYELVVYRHSPAVATMEGMRFREHDFELFPGDSLFVYTDGVAEATDANDKLYGTDRMLEALNKDPDTAPKALLTAIRASVDEFVGEAPQFDDLTMLGFTYHGPQE